MGRSPILESLKMSNTYKTLVAQLSAHRAAKTDLAKCINAANPKFGFSESTLKAGTAYGVDFAGIFNLPQKQVMRALQFINALIAGDYTGFDYTHARILCAMKLAGSFDLTTDAITALASATRTDKVNTRGIGYSALNTMFAKHHNISTVKTKVSNSTGVNGFYQYIGVTFAAPRERNHTIALNDTSPLVIRFFELINRATVGQLESMSGADK